MDFSMPTLSLPTVFSRLNLRIGTKLALTVGIGVVLVAGMMVNQHLSNTSVAQQAEQERAEQFVTADILNAGVGLLRMQIATREIRLAISEREAEQALAGLHDSTRSAVSYLQAAIQLGADTKNRERFEKLISLAERYAAAAAEIVALKKDFGEINKPLAQITTIGIEVDALIEKATSVATANASQRMAMVTAGSPSERSRISCCIWRMARENLTFLIPNEATRSAMRHVLRALFATIS
jgi:hypothetical protein